MIGPRPVEIALAVTLHFAVRGAIAGEHERALAAARQAGVPEEEVEDVAQDALLAGVASAGRYDPARGSISRWFGWGIAYHVASHASEASEARHRHLVLSGLVDAPPRAALAPDDALLAREVLGIVAEDGARSAFERFVEDWAVVELAPRLGVELRFAYRYFERLRAILRERAEEVFGAGLP